MTSSPWLTRVRKRAAALVELRRSIHQHPELGNDTPRTREKVLEALQNLPLQLALSDQTSGLIAHLDSRRPGPHILLRGDMDALPMPEDTGLPYASQIPGRMHACGHDAHTAMLAIAAQVICDHSEELIGKVSFMFQPGEENPGGALPMIKEGLLDYFGTPDWAFALHIYPNFSAGHIGCRPGPILASSDTLKIKITGKGGHGSMPHEANDPVPVACELVLALQVLATRRFSPVDPVIITVGKINGGTAANIIPESVDIELTLRTLSPEIRQKALAQIENLAQSLAKAHDMTARIEHPKGYPVTRNSALFVDYLQACVNNSLGTNCYIDMPAPFMGAEDFAYVLDKIPGAFAFIGVAPDGVQPGLAAACHSNRMLLNEDAMCIGSALHAELAASMSRLTGSTQ